MAKKLAVTIKVEMEVPDHWEVVQSAEGIEVLKIGENQFLDLTFEPMVATDIESEWSNSVSEEFIDELLDMVDSESVDYEMVTH